jgi:hypothetical protein
MRQAEDLSGLDKEQGTGDMPAIQQVVHSGRHKGAFIGYQTDVASCQVQPSIRSNTPGDGVMRRRHGDRVHDRRSNTNKEYKEKLTNSSIRLQERSTTLHSLARRPKALDKCVRQVDDRPSRVTEDSRGDHNGTRTMRRSYTNVVPGIDDDEVSCLSKEMVNE